MTHPNSEGLMYQTAWKLNRSERVKEVCSFALIFFKFNFLKKTLKGYNQCQNSLDPD